MPTPTIGLPSPTSLFIPNHAASNSLVVGFSRSPNTFPVSEYTQYIMVKQVQGVYFVWASRQAARILDNNDSRNIWADGAVAPGGDDNLEGGYYAPFITTRRAYAFTIGKITVENADFPILASMAAVAAQQAMTARTMLVYNSLSTASWGSNTIAVDGGLLTAGHNWKTGSDGLSGNDGPNILVSLQYGSLLVHKATIGVVQPAQLSLVINPPTAQAMSASIELRDYLKQSPFALAQVRGDVPNQNGKWGLPSMLYGFPLVIESTVRVTSQRGAASDALTYVIPDGEAYLLARQGELEGIEGSRSYSTVQIFFWRDELTVYSKYDGDNERYMGRVVSNYQPVTVTTYAGFRYTKCLG